MLRALPLLLLLLLLPPASAAGEAGAWRPALEETVVEAVPAELHMSVLLLQSTTAYDPLTRDTLHHVLKVVTTYMLANATYSVT
uniref:Uncharacterized protein n=1 Tax=Oryza brachyantha TaxID=4533 RepID=J3LX77_ORYBR